MRADTALDKSVFIDIDIVYADFKRSILWGKIQGKLPLIEEWIEAKVSLLRIRPSSSGNAHIEIQFNRPLTVLENLCVRSYCYDDIKRLNLDMIRWLKTGDRRRVNVLWSGKYKSIDFGAELYLCGHWEEIEYKGQQKTAIALQVPSQEPVLEKIPMKKEEDQDWPEMFEEYKPMPVEVLKKSPSDTTPCQPRYIQVNLDGLARQMK